MKFVGITACTTGVAHTYIAREKILQAAQALGYEAKIETQGSVGIEEELTEPEIAAADFVLISADIGIAGRDRFKNKKTVEVPLATIMKAPKAVLQKIAEKLAQA